MANVEHSTLTGSNLHENKGVASATDNTVATAVTGATVWAKLTASNLTGTGNPFGGQLYHVRDSVSSGTAAQTFSSTGTWLTRNLNTEVTDDATLGSVASNQITLAAGTYFCMGSAGFYSNPSFGTNINTKIRLRNVTDGSTLVLGMSNRLGNAASSTIDSAFIQTIQGRFTLSGSKVIELQQWLSAGSGSKGGFPASTGENEVYADLLIWKIA